MIYNKKYFEKKKLKIKKLNINFALIVQLSVFNSYGFDNIIKNFKQCFKF